MKLTYQQRKAINATDPFIMCVAAAGSAKTTVLTERIRLLLTERNVKAEDIVAITLTDLEAKHSRLGLNRAGVESKFYSEGALGELNPTLKTVLDILKGISSVRGHIVTGKQIGRAHV